MNQTSLNLRLYYYYFFQRIILGFIKLFKLEHYELKFDRLNSSETTAKSKIICNIHNNIPASNLVVFLNFSQFAVKLLYIQPDTHVYILVTNDHPLLKSTSNYLIN